MDNIALKAIHAHRSRTNTEHSHAHQQCPVLNDDELRAMSNIHNILPQYYLPPQGNFQSTTTQAII